MFHFFIAHDLKASAQVLIPKTHVQGSILYLTYESADDSFCHVIDSCQLLGSN